MFTKHKNPVSNSLLCKPFSTQRKFEWMKKWMMSLYLKNFGVFTLFQVGSGFLSLAFARCPVYRGHFTKCIIWEPYFLRAAKEKKVINIIHIILGILQSWWGHVMILWKKKKKFFLLCWFTMHQPPFLCWGCTTEDYSWWACQVTRNSTWKWKLICMQCQVSMKNPGW